MSSTEFCIKWTNYQTNIVNSVGKLRNDDEFVDVTLVCDDKRISAHKVILSACSDYFKEVFKTTPCSQHLVVLPHISAEDMLSLVQYMYTGQVYIHQDTLGRLLKTAQQLQVKGLIEQQQPGGLLRSGGEVEAESVKREKASVTEAKAEPASTISSSGSPLLLSPFHQLTPPPSVSPSSSASSLPSPGKMTTFPTIKIPSPPTPTYNWSRPNPLQGILGGAFGVKTPGSQLGIASPFSINHSLPDTKATANDVTENNGNEEMRDNDESEDELVIEEPDVAENLSKESFKKETHSPSSSLDQAVDAQGSHGGLDGHLAEERMRLEAMGEEGGAPGVVTTNNNASVTHPRQRWRCMQPRLCNYCWKTFSNSFNLKQHIVNVHIQSQGVNCNICDKVVKNKWYLRKHLVTAHGAPLKRSKNAENTNLSQD